MGGSNGSTIILKGYHYNGSSFVLNWSGDGTRFGSFGLIDYDKDEDLDISQEGLSTSDIKISRILKKG